MIGEVRWYKWGVCVHLCICVFVFLYLYLCICIFVFVFAYLYLSICTQRQQLIGGVGWYEWCSCTTPLGGLSLSLSHNLNANTTIDFGQRPIQCNQNLMNLWFFFYKSLHLLWLRFQTLWQTLMLINVNYKLQISLSSFSRKFSVEIFQFLVITLAPSWKDALALILSNLTFLTFDGKFILGFKKRGSDQYCG